MKKKIITMAAALALVVTAIVGRTLAEEVISASSEGASSESSTGSETVSNNNIMETLSIGDLAVALSSGIPDVPVSFPVSGMPGEIVKLNPKLSVSNERDFSAYIRVKIDKQWNSDADLDAGMVTFDTPSEDWLVMSAENDTEQIVLYYKKPIGQSENTAPFLKEVHFDSSMNNEYADKEIDITITVDAVQAEVAEKAMLSEWGVMPDLAADGTIIKILE